MGLPTSEEDLSIVTTKTEVFSWMGNNTHWRVGLPISFQFVGHYIFSILYTRTIVARLPFQSVLFVYFQMKENFHCAGVYVPYVSPFSYTKLNNFMSYSMDNQILHTHTHTQVQTHAYPHKCTTCPHAEKHCLYSLMYMNDFTP